MPDNTHQRHPANLDGHSFWIYSTTMYEPDIDRLLGAVSSVIGWVQEHGIPLAEVRTIDLGHALLSTRGRRGRIRMVTGEGHVVIGSPRRGPIRLAAGTSTAEAIRDEINASHNDRADGFPVTLSTTA